MVICEVAAGNNNGFRRGYPNRLQIMNKRMDPSLALVEIKLQMEEASQTETINSFFGSNETVESWLQSGVTIYERPHEMRFTMLRDKALALEILIHSLDDCEEVTFSRLTSIPTYNLLYTGNQMPIGEIVSDLIENVGFNTITAREENLNTLGGRNLISFKSNQRRLIIANDFTLFLNNDARAEITDKIGWQQCLICHLFLPEGDGMRYDCTVGDMCSVCNRPYHGQSYFCRLTPECRT